VDGFSVDPQELIDAANVTGGFGRALRAGGTLSYAMRPGEVGDQLLAEAVADLQQATTRAANVLEKNSQEVSSRLASTEAEYRKLDHAQAALLDDLEPGRHA
jgi:hypothetical protein